MKECSDQDMLEKVADELVDLCDPNDPYDPLSDILDQIQKHLGYNLDHRGRGRKRHLIRRDER